MSLNPRQSDPLDNFIHEILRITYEHTNFFYLRRKSLHNLFSVFRRNISRTFFVKNKSHRIRACVNRDLCVFQIRNPANLYPGHGIRPRAPEWPPLPAALAMLSPAKVPSSKIRQSEMLRSPPPS